MGTNRMKNETLTIIILSVIIIGLLVFIFAGRGNAQIALESLRKQRTELVRSTAVIQGELVKSRGYNQELETDNLELERIIDNLTTGSEKTESDLNEYGNINTDFAEFLRSATITD